MRTRSRLVAAVAAAALPLAISCSDRITTDTEMVWDQPSSGSGQPAADTTFTMVQTRVFTPSCALAGCHADGGYPNLAAGQAWASLVNVPSSAGMALITPGDLQNSYLYQKITGGPAMQGSRMPYGGGALAAADVAVVRAWIARGAPND